MKSLGSLVVLRLGISKKGLYFRTNIPFSQAFQIP